MLESTSNEVAFKDIKKILKQKLTDYHVNGKPDQLPEYAVHQILHLLDIIPEFRTDDELREPKQFLIETH